MKKILCIILVVSSLAACKKSGVSPVNVIGKWELHERRGGFILPADSVYQAGNGNIYQFNQNGSYQLYVNGTAGTSGTYRVSKDTVFFTDNLSDRASYSIVAVSGNTLTFLPEMVDMGTMIYIKVQN